jgi:hypothetical protein
MLIFLTGGGGQGKTATARLLAQNHGWQAVLNDDHQVIDQLDPARKRFEDDDLYLDVKTTAWGLFKKQLIGILDRPKAVVVVDSCPFLYRAAVLRRFGFLGDFPSQWSGSLEQRALDLLGEISCAARRVMDEKPLFFYFPFGRVGAVKEDFYRSTSMVSQMALAEIVLANLVDHGCRYREVSVLDEMETADWIAQQVLASAAPGADRREASAIKAIG